MRGSSSGSSKKRTRVLFLAWGFSIHARRRIQIFVDDPSFEVAVASTYNYRFSNATNVLLSGGLGNEETYRNNSLLGRGNQTAKGNPGKIAGLFPRKLSVIKDLPGVGKFLLSGRKVLRAVLSAEDRTSIYGLKTTDFILSSDLQHEILRACLDLKKLKNTLREFKPDIIFLQTLLYPCYLAFFLSEKIPLVITFWNGDLTWWAQWSGIERRFKKALVNYGLLRAQAITVNSASALKACLQYGAREEKIRLIRYPGVDLERFRELEKNEAKRQLGIGFEKVVLLPRGLGEYLNSDVIIEAIPIVIRKYPDTLFLFLSGNGREKEWEMHLQKAKQFGAEEHVRWDGKVPWELMGRYYNASDMMVSISSNDSLPNCMLEAMACGTPILMGDIPPIREWVTDGVNGFLVPPRDPVSLSEKIIRALDAPEEMVRAFTQRNLELARRVFDSRRNSQAIKKLVHGIAEYHAEKARQGTHKNRSQLKG